MIVLSIETSTESASCAVIDENRLLGEITFNYKKQHSVILMDIIDKLLSNVALDITSIDGFVISMGPGSFTGLRIGLATIKGLAHGANKPFIGISTLDALANNMSYTSGIICPILDALRGNVYSALYKFEGTALIRIKEPEVVSLEELMESIKAEGLPATFIGDAVPMYKDKIFEILPESKMAPVHLNFARASALGELGLKELKLGKQDDINTFAPVYLRKSQAEREYDKKVGNISND
jgi:tRNA threonylcarbamoyl adenosine modification protein YeaZ